MCEGCVEDGSIHPELFRLIEEYNRIDPDAQFRGGHITFADCNVEDHHIQFCLAEETITRLDRLILSLMLLIPEDVRVPGGV